MAGLRSAVVGGLGALMLVGPAAGSPARSSGVLAPASDPPKITSVAPRAGPTAGGNRVTLSGSGFAPGAVVKFGSANAASVTVFSSSRLGAMAPPNDRGVVDITVKTAAGSSSITPADRYTYYPRPAISGVVPNHGLTAGGELVTVTGKAFIAQSRVSFGRVASPRVTFVSTKELTAVAPAHAAGTVDVRVSTPGGSSALRVTDKYAYGPPSVTSLVPAAGQTAGGNVVRVLGGSFLPGATVKFGAAASPSVSFVSGGELRAVAPAHTAGVADVSVTTPAGTSALSSGDRYVYGPPEVSSLNPRAAPVAGGTIHILGQRFAPGASVKFGATRAVSVTVLSDFNIRAVAPAHAAGVVDVTVTTAGGTSPASDGARLTYGPPVVSYLSPQAGPADSGQFVGITGAGFVVGATVEFGGFASRQVVVTSSDYLYAWAPQHSAGTVPVSVTTPGGTSAPSAAAQYTYVPRPTVSSLIPPAGPTSGGSLVTINGSGFRPEATLDFGGVPSSSVSVITSTLMTAIVPAHTYGLVDVRVSTVGGSSSPALKFAYGRPWVGQTAPNAGPSGGGNLVTITGTNLAPGATVRFGNAVSGSVTWRAWDRLTAVAPAHSAGTVDVSVTTAAGNSVPTANTQYTYYPRPEVTGVSPRTGSLGGGNTVTITGHNLVPGNTSVMFGDVAAPSVAGTSATQLTATAPAHGGGSVHVTVTTPGGTSASVPGDLYAYGPPAIASFSPSSGITGSHVTIAGSGFVPGMTVMFGGRISPSVTAVSGTSLNVTVPDGAMAARITVSQAQGSAMSAVNFTPTLSITSFTPPIAQAGHLVTINGIGFNSSSAVKFNGRSAASTTFVSPTELEARPAATNFPETGPITVTNSLAPAGTVRSASLFTVT